MQVTITKDEQGNFSVAQGDPGQDAAAPMATDPNAAQPAMPGQPAATPDADADSDGTKGTPAKDLKDALLMAAKMLMSDSKQSSYDQAFDQGLNKNKPAATAGAM